MPEVDLLDTNNDFIEPETTDAKTFAKIWAELFDTDKISTNYNFFAIGGDSLLAIKLSAKILDVFGVDISVKDIFNTPIFSDLLQLILINKDAVSSKIKVAKPEDCYPLSSAQKRIYYTNSMTGHDSIVYNLPGGLIVKDILDVKKVEDTFNKLIENILVLEHLLNLLIINQCNLLRKI